MGVIQTHLVFSVGFFIGDDWSSFFPLPISAISLISPQQPKIDSIILFTILPIREIKQNNHPKSPGICTVVTL